MFLQLVVSRFRFLPAECGQGARGAWILGSAKQGTGPELGYLTQWFLKEPFPFLCTSLCFSHLFLQRFSANS